jgi:tRNA nucleotidyltransferase (CCA-adding enzyme)
MRINGERIMEIYLVGGAVRDALLGLPVKEKDWVVVNSTAEELLQAGYLQVGKDFPVFLHPKSKEEYALARVERKVGLGYTGFTFDASPNVTLEEDLLRRDLTINAIAQKKDGSLIDPFHGKSDLDNKILRHVSQAFAEDPVRILRVGRFAARFAALGFTVAPETTALMKEMVQAGEVDALVAERVWKELERALQEKNPAEFFLVLASCGALSILFPAITQDNINTLQRIASITEDAESRFAAVCFGMDKATLSTLCKRYRVPTDYRESALLVLNYYADYCHAKTLNAEQLLQFLQAADAFRRPERFTRLLQACAALSGEFANSQWLLAVNTAAQNVNIKAVLAEVQSGPQIADLLKQKRLESIKKLIS